MNRFAEMDCFVLAGGRSNEAQDFLTEGGLPRLEKSYRRYATIFEKVRLVLKPGQARERYLNYPHICDEDSRRGVEVGIMAALRQSRSEALFIGSSDIVDFPLELAVDLVRKYDGELFLGYCDDSSDSRQPLFGIFSKKLLGRLREAGRAGLELSGLLDREGKLLPLPRRQFVRLQTSP